jgi:sulfate transport system permease protein
MAARSLQIPWGAWGLRLAAVGYIGAFVAVPVVVIIIQGFRGGLEAFVDALSSPAAVSAIVLTVWTSAIMTVINMVMGTITAFALVRYEFPGRDLLNTLVDLPFAVPTLVTGVMLVVLYGPQTFIGEFFDNLGLRIIFAPPGIVLALLFVGYPFVIRAVQPVLEVLDANQQEAARTLGASEWTIFRRIIFPVIRPAIIAGGLLSFARSLGEFGAIIIVSGNIPMRSQTATVYLYAQVEAGNLQAASAVSLVLVVIAVMTTLAIDRSGVRRRG